MLSVYTKATALVSYRDVRQRQRPNWIDLRPYQTPTKKTIFPASIPAAPHTTKLDFSKNTQSLKIHTLRLTLLFRSKKIWKFF